MTYLNPDIYQYESINGDGLISTFFENIKNNNIEINKTKFKIKHSNNDIILYINTFDTPDQLQMLMDSFEKYEPKFLVLELDSNGDIDFILEYVGTNQKYRKCVAELIP